MLRTETLAGGWTKKDRHPEVSEDPKNDAGPSRVARPGRAGRAGATGVVRAGVGGTWGNMSGCGCGWVRVWVSGAEGRKMSKGIPNLHTKPCCFEQGSLDPRDGGDPTDGGKCPKSYQTYVLNLVVPNRGSLNPQMGGGPNEGQEMSKVIPNLRIKPCCSEQGVRNRNFWRSRTPRDGGDVDGWVRGG